MMHRLTRLVVLMFCCGCVAAGSPAQAKTTIIYGPTTCSAHSKIADGEEFVVKETHRPDGSIVQTWRQNYKRHDYRWKVPHGTPCGSSKGHLIKVAPARPRFHHEVIPASVT